MTKIILRKKRIKFKWYQRLFMMALLLFFIPSVFAANEDGKIVSGGNLLITDFDIKVDSLTSRNIEYGDTLNRIANPSSKIEFDLQLKNNHTGSDMENIEIIIRIDELDLEKSVANSALAKNTDARFTAEMTLPSDAEEKNYEVFVQANGELNNTIHKIEYIFYIKIESKDSPSSNPAILQQINDSLAKLNADLKYYPLYTQCYTDLETSKTDLVAKNTKIAELEPNKANYETCSKSLAETQTTNLDLGSKLSTSQQSLETCTQELDKSNKNALLYGVLGALLISGIWAYQNRKQTPFTKKAKIARS